MPRSLDVHSNASVWRARAGLIFVSLRSARNFTRTDTFRALTQIAVFPITRHHAVFGRPNKSVPLITGTSGAAPTAGPARRVLFLPNFRSLIRVNFVLLYGGTYAVFFPVPGHRHFPSDVPRKNGKTTPE